MLIDYGIGAIFDVPVHDQRDLDFYNTYRLNVLPVVLPAEDAKTFAITDTAYTGNGVGYSIMLLTDLMWRLAKRQPSLRLQRLMPVSAKQLTGCEIGVCRDNAIGDAQL